MPVPLEGDDGVEGRGQQGYDIRFFPALRQRRGEARGDVDRIVMEEQVSQLEAAVIGSDGLVNGCAGVPPGPPGKNTSLAKDSVS